MQPILRLALTSLLLLGGASCGIVQPASTPPGYGSFRSGGPA